MPGAEHVLVVGVSTRAAAESAARAGFVVTAIDAFADLDQHPSVRALSLQRDFQTLASAHALVRAARGVASDAVAYLANLENHPVAVGSLAEGRALWGNPPAVLKRVRDPELLEQVLRRRRSATPEVRFSTASRSHAGAGRPEPVEGRWLVKPLASGGGHGVRPWRPGSHWPRRCYLQQLVDGTPGSVAFVAAGGRAVPLGVFRQLVGEQAFGASGYQYCGNILMAAGDGQLGQMDVRTAASALATVVAEEFGVVGVNGIDFVARGGIPYAIEVNPRWSAAMELAERAYGLSIYGAHAAACAAGALPRFDLERAQRDTRAVGKAVVFARCDVTVGNSHRWLVGGNVAGVRDVPQPGERIPVGRPVCTVFADGRDAAACHAELVRRAELVYAELAAARTYKAD